MGLVREGLARALARLKLRRCARVGAHPTVLGGVWIHGPGRVVLGDRVVVDAREAPVELHTLNATAEIVIGDDVVLGAGTSIEAERRVTIGHRCRFGPFTKVLDNHFHPLRGDRHARPPSVPVVVEDDVEVERRAILLPGAHLQRGVRVCAESVVSRRVPAGLVVSGVPAVRVRTGAR